MVVRPASMAELARVAFVPRGARAEVRVTPMDIDDEKAFWWAATERVREYALINEAVRDGVEIVYDSRNPKACVVPLFRSDRWDDRNGNLFKSTAVFVVLATTLVSLVRLQSGAAHRLASKRKNRQKSMEERNPFE